MRHSIVFAAMACAWLIAAPVAADPATPAPALVENLLTMPVDGHVAIATDGSVREFKVDTQLTPEMTAMLERVVKQWSFELKPVDGAIHAVESPIRISLAATRADTGYQVRIENVTFPPPSAPTAPAASTSGSTTHWQLSTRPR